MKKIFLTIIGVLAVEALVCAIFVFSGAYNVSTANHDNGFINWWLDKGATRSVKAHAGRDKVPDLDNPALIQEGFQHFHDMCASCHGAPGRAPGELAKGFWPEAPNLAEAVPDWTPGQLFWITKNGIKFTAMPGWGATHSDDKLWAITAFLKKLPKLSPADYQKMEANTVGLGSSSGPGQESGQP